MYASNTGKFLDHTIGTGAAVAESRTDGLDYPAACDRRSHRRTSRVSPCCGV
jgi:hypothetical protein